MRSNVYDVITEETQEITQIKWCKDTDYNLVKFKIGAQVGIGLDEMYIVEKGEFQCDDQDRYPLVETAEDAENLIKALQKAIELGWVK